MAAKRQRCAGAELMNVICLRCGEPMRLLREAGDRTGGTPALLRVAPWSHLIILHSDLARQRNRRSSLMEAERSETPRGDWAAIRPSGFIGVGYQSNSRSV